MKNYFYSGYSLIFELFPKILTLQMIQFTVINIFF